MDVGTLLRNSLAKHRQAHQLRQRDKVQALEVLRQARDLRVQAIGLDPGRIDPAWTDEQKATPAQTNTHDELMRFYTEMLG